MIFGHARVSFSEKGGGKEGAGEDKKDRRRAYCLSACPFHVLPEVWHIDMGQLNVL